MACDNYGDNCLKLFTFLINFLSLVGSLIALTIASYSQIQSRGVTQLVDTPDFETIGVIIISSIAILLSFLGCCATIREHVYSLYVFAAISVLIALAQLTIAVFLLNYSATIKGNMETKLTEKLRLYDNSQQFVGFWDNLQNRFECCGSKNFTDWLDIELESVIKTNLDNYGQNSSIPRSCFDLAPNWNSNAQKARESWKFENLNSNSCSDATERFFRTMANVLGGLFVLVATINLIASIFAIGIAKATRCRVEFN